MDEFVYNAYDKYFGALGKTGYLNQGIVDSLLVLDFYYQMIYQDYRGYITKEDYHTIERALNCLYGTNCLIPYPDYLKMGKLKLGEMTEVLMRTKAIEDYSKELDQRILDNDVLIEDNIRRLDENDRRVVTIENTKVIKSKNHIQNIPDIDLEYYDVIPDDPEPEHIVHIVKVYDTEHISVPLDETCYIVPFKDITDIFNNHDNCRLSGNIEGIKLYTYWYDEGHMDEAEPLLIGEVGEMEDSGITTGSVTLPYTFTNSDINTLLNTVTGRKVVFIDWNSVLSKVQLEYVE